MINNVNGQFAQYLESKGIDLDKLKDMSAIEFEVLTSLFVQYCDENSDSVDFGGLTLPDGISEEESRTFFQVLREFFSLETIKLKADRDGNTYLDEEEVEDFLRDNINDIDNDGSDISLEDLEGALTKFGITLPATPSSTTSSTIPSGGGNTGGGGGGIGDVGGNGDGGGNTVDPAPSPSPAPSGSADGTTAIDYPAQAAADSANYVNTPLETLYDMRYDLSGDVADARTDLQSLADGSNTAVAALVKKRDDAQQALYNAMALDSETVKALGDELKTNDDAVDENDRKTIEALANLSDKQAELGNVQSQLASTKLALEATTGDLTSARNELSALSEPSQEYDEDGNETQASKDARAAYNSQKQALETKISNLEQEEARLTQAQTDLEKQEETLNGEITTLNTTLNDLEASTKDLAIAREDIMTRLNTAELSPETQAAKTAWEQACNDYNEGVTQLYLEYSAQLENATMKLNAIEYAIIQKENIARSNGEETPAWIDKDDDDDSSTYLVTGSVEDQKAYLIATQLQADAQMQYDTTKGEYDTLLASIGSGNAPVNTATLGRLETAKAAFTAAEQNLNSANALVAQIIAQQPGLQGMTI